MAADRTPRDTNSREAESRENSTREKTGRYEYQPASVLPEPKQDPDYVFRWVATHVMGVLDPTNASTRFRDGWEPVKATDHPELMVSANKDGNVEIGGLMLCRMPRERAKARDEYYRRQAEAQIQAVDNNFMRQSDARMPLFSEKKTEVTRGGAFGKGNNR